MPLSDAPRTRYARAHAQLRRRAPQQDRRRSRPAPRGAQVSGTVPRKLRSRIPTDGVDRAPHRVFMRGMGLDDDAIARPFIGIVTTAGETTPCTGNLAEQASHAHEGVRAAGGTPRSFTTISISDGISMNHQGMKCSLVSREVIADSIELVVRGHRSEERRVG